MLYLSLAYVGADGGVNILWPVLAQPRPVPGPVGEVADNLVVTGQGALQHQSAHYTDRGPCNTSQLIIRTGGPATPVSSIHSITIFNNSFVSPIKRVDQRVVKRVWGGL